jgi:uncharacterized protein YcbX
MQVKELWRYPVKSMRGERVAEADVLATGMAGDREIVVGSPRTGRLITARTHPGLLGLQAAVQSDGSVTVDGLPWQSREAAELVEHAVKEHVDLVNLKESTDRFDVLPLLVATDGAIEELGIDSRRLRPNVIVSGVAGRAERDWPGHVLRAGEVLIDVAQLRGRCVMTTYDPDTLKQDLNVLRNIVKKMQGKTALDCSVAQAGRLREGDIVELLKGDNDA